MVQDISHTMDTWIKELDHYSFERLMIKPAPDSWSLGQLYIHLIEASNYFIRQIKLCLSTNDNANGESRPEAKSMFLNNDLPDALLPGPPSNGLTVQPQSKEQILEGLLRVKGEIEKLVTEVAEGHSIGKAKHFGLGFFTAQEWLQFAEMHMRHHLRQKKRIDKFLQSIN